MVVIIELNNPFPGTPNDVDGNEKTQEVLAKYIHDVSDANSKILIDSSNLDVVI